MKLRVLRPVGEPLPPARYDLDTADVLPAGYEARFVRSGTAALALALLVAKQASDGNRTKVLLPAYGCPDLVAAVLFAGLDPELVDTAEDLPFFDLERLEERLDHAVLAVVAVHFLGLAERVGAVEELARKVDAVVIEDSAQRLPGMGSRGAVSDLVVLSFGRGKPAGALGGGALLIRSGTGAAVDYRGLIGTHEKPGLPPYLKRHLYNLAIRPIPYAILSRLPGMRLGETRFRPLTEIRSLDPVSKATALATLSSRTYAAANPAQERLRAIVGSLTMVRDIVSLADGQDEATLTRYPVLLHSRDARDAVHHALTRKGLGSSVMYGAALVDIPGVSARCAVPPVAARAFADRLLTLPVHSSVREKDLNEIAAVLAQFPD